MAAEIGPVHYRHATSDDLEAIVALHVDVWRATYRDLAPAEAFDALGRTKRRAGWAATLASTAQTTFVACQADALLGIMSVGPATQPAYGDAGEIKHLYVAGSAARQGIGRALLAIGLNHLRTEGYSRAGLAVVQGNTKAEAFYAAQGGEPSGSFTDEGPLWRSLNTIYTWTLDPALTVVENDTEVYAEYAANFAAYNAEAAGLTTDTFSIVKRDATGKIIAGGRGHVYLGALEVRGLWVDPAQRGTGLGSTLLTAIESEARTRGATKAMLYTYSWQAEAFYTRHGYRAFGRFEFPAGHARINMEKGL